ncbi:putative alanine rich protein [Mycolicibacterium conceptionense]|uniref:Putative alanine rich protein n=1 Tax=Mycolicibacterium conceptionense TaxID=451644 RepID=A0A0U1DTK4_9MYCO|nr:putative alanine rich protein [Mycolicibacterium conceptionense]
MQIIEAPAEVGERRFGIAGLPRADDAFTGSADQPDRAVVVHPAADRRRAVELPLCALIAGWIRGQAAPDAAIEVHAYAATQPVDQAMSLGRTLRARIEESADPVGVLVVADGLHTLTPSAPGGYLPDSVATQQDLDDALATGDLAGLAELPESVLGRVAYQVLAGLTWPEPGTARELYRGALRVGVLRR